ncbi:MAG: DUF3945 domain-containing protein, partial [Rudanella sp.]|nr:DUF3945 domain-containing protein [Rudanella sp.]
VMRQDRVHIPHTMHGVKLTPEQQESIREGKPTRIEGMIGPKDGKPFDAYVQASPAIRRFKFRRIPEQQLKEELKNAPRQTVKNEGPVKANKKVQGKQPEAEKQKVGAKQKGEADQKKETKTNVSVQEKNGLSRTTVNQSQVKTNGPKTNSPAVKPTQKNTDQVEVVSNKPEKAAKVKSTRKIKR